MGYTRLMGARRRNSRPPRLLGALTVLATAIATVSAAAPAFALSAPGPDLEITKTASTASVEPGDTVTYTVTVKNVGTVDLPGVRFTDDLTDNLDDAVYDGDAVASAGKVSYAEPELSYVGDIRAGQSATVTYSVTVGAAGTGDGSLRNSVVAESTRSNCAADSHDEKCMVTPVVVVQAVPEEPSSPMEPRDEAADDSGGNSSGGTGDEGTEEEAAEEGVAKPQAPGAAGHGPAAGTGTHGSLPQLAATGITGERLWLLGGVAVALAAAGAVALAATRDRRRNH
ncbi:CARDB domain-containing protein [Streptomyces sp. NPDC059909]|uniref:DUF7927 domain-containing protein n=1 Tax=Streptomyces sp. NPDC059909 TaxID=3346998 RepID=UPI00365F79C7